MKIKRLITAALLAFVAASIVVLAAQALRPTAPAAPASPAASPGGDTVIVWYFRTSMRCPSCLKIEAYAHEAVQKHFADELKSGRLVWRVVNVEEPGNEHYIQDYQLVTKSVIVSTVRDGRQTAWKNLDRIWELIPDKPGFIAYVRDEVAASLRAGR
jgi:hypothetical protein